MKELAEKVLYCIQMMQLVCWLTSLINDDYGKRVLARYILVYLDAFLDLAPRLKNQIKNSVLDVDTVTQKINRLRTNYESYYATIRDKLVAHRQDLPLALRIETWNEIDDTTVNIFIDDVTDIYTNLRNLDSQIKPFVESSALKINALKKEIQAVKSNNIPKIAVDNLAMSRPNVITVIPNNEMQERGTQIASILHIIDFLRILYPILAVNEDTQRLGKAMLIVDVFSFIDNLYPYSSGNQNYQIKSLLEICQEEQLNSCSILKDSYDKRDTVVESEFRDVRNKIAAHVDPNQPLADLLALLDSKEIDELINKIFIPAYGAFEEWCQSDILTSTFLIDCTPAVNITEVEDLGGLKPYS